MPTPDARDPLRLSARVVEQARARGADVAEANLEAVFARTVRVRLGTLEQVEEAERRSLALRLLRGDRVGQSVTTDLSTGGLERCVTEALALAELSDPDPAARPAEPEALGHGARPELDLFDPGVDALSVDEAIERARRAEAAALGFDSRLTLSDGASFGWSTTSRTLLLSTGFAATELGSQAALEVSPGAEDAGGKRRIGGHFTAHRHLAGLEDPVAVGQEAARRTLRMLGARSVTTCEVPVVFDPDVARMVLDKLAGCVVGGALWRKSSYLVGRIGEPVASELVTIVDDPSLPRGLGSRSFDGEGLPARRNVVIERGTLRSYLLDCCAARKLGLSSTGSAKRDARTITAAPTNFFLEAGAVPPERIVADTPRGLYVTDLLGFGFNPVTGDFSQGAAGLWIEDGRLAFPVSEVTVSSNLESMLRAIDAIGTDLVPKSPVFSPTFRVGAMTIAGS